MKFGINQMAGNTAVYKLIGKKMVELKVKLSTIVITTSPRVAQHHINYLRYNVDSEVHVSKSTSNIRIKDEASSK